MSGRSRSWVLTVVLLAMGACAHGLSPCGACGPGFVCQPIEGYADETFEQCFRGCHADTDCPAGDRCNCDVDNCSVHSGQIPFNVCVGAPQKVKDPEFQPFFAGPQDRLSCTTCAPDEQCLNVGHGKKPDFECFKQCTRSSQCPPPQVCNCAVEQNGRCMDDYPQNMCFVPPSVPPTGAGE